MASSVTPSETNLPPRRTCFISLPMNHHHSQPPPTFWNAEKIANEPTQKDVLSTYDEEALQILQDTCRHSGERYEIGLPWKRDTPLSNNYFAALKRFREHPQKKIKFDESLKKDLEKGYVKQVKMQHPPPREFGTSPRIPARIPINQEKSVE